jgi:hypothetical protein
MRMTMLKAGILTPDCQGRDGVSGVPGPIWLQRHFAAAAKEQGCQLDLAVMAKKHLVWNNDTLG